MPTLISPLQAFKQAWNVYKNNLLTILGVLIIPFIAGAVAMAVMSFIGLTGDKISGLQFGGIIVLAVIGFLLYLWSQTALLIILKESQSRLSIKEAYQRAWPKIVSYLWVVILSGFVTMGGFILFVIPGIIFAVWFSLAWFVLIEEDLRGMNALLKSREYVKGKWWGVLGRFLLVFILSVVISMVVSSALLLTRLPMVAEAGNQLVMSLVVGPLVMAYMYEVYKSLKASKEGMVFTPTSGQKTTFIVIGVVGLLLIPVVLSAIVLFGLKTALEKSSQIPSIPAEYNFESLPVR